MGTSTAEIKNLVVISRTRFELFPYSTLTKRVEQFPTMDKEYLNNIVIEIRIILLWLWLFFILVKNSANPHSKG